MALSEAIDDRTDAVPHHGRGNVDRRDDRLFTLMHYKRREAIAKATELEQKWEGNGVQKDLKAVLNSPQSKEWGIDGSMVEKITRVLYEYRQGLKKIAWRGALYRTMNDSNVDDMQELLKRPAVLVVVILTCRTPMTFSGNQKYRNGRKAKAGEDIYREFKVDLRKQLTL